MSIAQQVATPGTSQPARRPSHPLVPAPKRRPVRALLRIVGLLALMATGVTLTLGTVAVVLILVTSNLTG